MARWPSAGLLLALAVAGGAARADWTAVGEANEIYAAFADRATIRRTGALATMHGLYDFRRQDFTPEGRALFSTVVLREYDCGARRVRLLSSIDFSGPMGSGEPVLVSDRPGRWESVQDSGVDAAYWQAVCGGG